MITNIILAACFIPVLPVMYFIIRNNAKPKKNIILGVTLPYAAHSDSATWDICRSFLGALNAVMLPLLPLVAPPFFMKTAGASMTWFMTWLMVLIIAPHAVFAVYRNRLMALKRARGWGSAAEGRTLADVKVAAIPAKKVNVFWFLAPVVIGFIPVAACLMPKAEWTDTFVYLTFALMIPVFWLCYHFIYRVRSEAVNENITLTMALTRVRRYNWSKFFLTASWLTAAVNLLLWWFEGNIIAFLIIVLAYTVILLAASMQTEFAARFAQQKLTAGDVGELFWDEDEYWIWGILYHNPNDAHFLVNDRIGMNMSMNLARPAAKVLAAIAVLCILAMPFFGIWMWAEEVTPPVLVLSDTALTARHTSEQYVIPLSQITSVELKEALPSMRRTMGSGFESLLKGNFSVGGYGASKVCLNPKTPPFLTVKAGGTTYFLNDADSAVTLAVYNALAGDALLSEDNRVQWDIYNTRAEEFVTAMANGDFDAAAAMFDAAMAKALTAQNLQSDVWNVAVKQAGAYEGVYGIENTQSGGYYICFVTSEHEKSGVMLRVVFNEEGFIAGLFIDGYPAIDS